MPDIDLLVQVIEQSADPTIISSSSQDIMYINSAAESLFEVAASDAINHPLTKFLPDKLRSLEESNSTPLKKERRIGRGHRLLSGKKSNGESCQLYASLAPFKHDNDSAYLITLHSPLEMSETEHAQSHLQRSQIISELASNAILYIDHNHNCTYANPQFSLLTGLPQNKIFGLKWHQLIHPDDAQAVIDDYALSHSNQQNFYAEFRLRSSQDEHCWINCTARPLTSENNTLTGYIASFVSTDEDNPESTSYNAHYDVLTGLANRTLFLDRLQQACLRTERHGMVALLYLNLDEFKVINETLGHDLGDRLLASFADRLTTCVRREDTVARFGGDEFTILLENITDDQQANKVAANIAKKSEASFEIDDRTFFVSTSIGIAITQNNQQSPYELIKQADIAMHKAKEIGRRTYHHFTPALNKATLLRMSLGNDLHHAIKQEEFHIHYQPQIHTQTGNIVGTEALLRWKHPAKGLISPSKFVPILEANGLITHVGNWLIDNVIAQKASWSKTYPASKACSVSINVSAKQLWRGDIVKILSDALKKHEVDPEEITLEITESVILKDSGRVKRLLTRLRNIGVSIALDDFGTGYSSLSYLKKFPINQIKIDQSFIRDILTDPDDNAIATAIIELGHSLNLDVVAEGVDCLEKVEYLSSRGCNLLQGFYFSKAVSATRIDWSSAQPTGTDKRSNLVN